MGTLKLLVVAVSMIVLSGCSGDLAGNVFVRMESGDIKRGADLEVVLINASSEFESEWAKLLEGYKDGGNQWRDQSREARTGYLVAYKAHTADILNPAKKEAWEAASARFSEFTTQLKQMEDAHRKLALKLIDEARKVAVRTNVDGQYQFIGVRRGKYYIRARYEDGKNVLNWMVPAEVGSGSQKVDLSNSNSGSLLAYGRGETDLVRR